MPPYKKLKRYFDFFLAMILLVLFAPVFLLTALLISSTSKGPIFFKQKRIGRDFQPFTIYKFRTMVQDAAQLGAAISTASDPRITKIGVFLRHSKIDEIPQLFNVLIGDMSFIGPRPEVHEFVELFRKDFEPILTFRPGITGVASITFRHEAAMLNESQCPKEMYIREILPKKIELEKDYIRQSSFIYDMKLILKTIFIVLIK